MRIKKTHTSEFKAKVALTALKENRTMSELASDFGVHPISIGLWKKTATDNFAHLFDGQNGAQVEAREQKNLIEKLYGKIGEIEMENDWLKKKLGL